MGGDQAVPFTPFETLFGVVQTADHKNVPFVQQRCHTASFIIHIRETFLTVQVLITVDRLLLNQGHHLLERRSIGDLIVEAPQKNQVLIGQVHSGRER